MTASIALCMIVRNEAPVIERCLKSVRPLIDTWVVCDTGSDDGTPELIEQTLDGMPGQVHETPWVDFGHNRSLLMELARGSADYLLLLDADMTVRSRGELPELEADAYMLRESGSLDFGVLRLVRGDREWWYEGSTHEHIATDGRFEQQVLDALLIEHHADGSSRTSKLLRDIGLLKRDLRRDPYNPRPYFYLAQTYRDLGRRDLAIDYYDRRVELGGWDEEVFYARLQQGALMASVDLDEAVPVLLNAWERRPTRAEPLYELARAHRLIRQYNQAELYATRGLSVAYPSDVLFVHRWVYEWGLALEHALALLGLGRRDEGIDELQALLESEQLPRDVEKQVGELLARFSTATPATGTNAPRRLEELAPSTRIGEIQIDVRPRWPPFNPSIARAGDGFRMVVRTANYAIERGVLHEEGIQQNLNYVLELDSGLGVRSIEPLVDRSQPQRFPSRVQGPEDCRLFEIDGRWFATATVCDLNPVERREIGLLSLDGYDVAETLVLAGPNPGRHEKNWMPFLRDGRVLAVYSCSPTVVLALDLATGHTEVVANHEAPAWAERMRGGSQGVPVDGGTLFVTHEVTADAAALRYLHRFVLIDDDLRLAAATSSFTFTTDRIEFCAGMAQAGDDLVLSFGVSDAAAGLGLVNRSEVMGLLKRVAKTAPHT
jgi:glycosyltransferase involved in cell wall biosynthesis/predicted GH43/DUF377 family glycosyl hydrolase